MYLGLDGLLAACGQAAFEGDLEAVQGGFPAGDPTPAAGPVRSRAITAR